jgi:hypothetical protein
VRGGPPSTVRIGLTTPTNPFSGKEVQVRCVNQHPDYDGNLKNDVAVIKLDEAVTITPAQLNTNSSIPISNEQLTVIGKC